MLQDCKLTNKKDDGFFFSIAVLPCSNPVDKTVKQISDSSSQIEDIKLVILVVPATFTAVANGPDEALDCCYLIHVLIQSDMQILSYLSSEEDSG